MRFRLPLPPSVNRKAKADKDARALWREIIEASIFESLAPTLRYSFRYCVMGNFEKQDGGLKRRDHFNLEKPLVDDVCKALGIDDKQIVRIEGWKVHQAGEEYVLVDVEECLEERPIWV